MLYAIIGIVVVVLFIVYGRWLKNKYLKITKLDCSKFEEEKKRLEVENYQIYQEGERRKEALAQYMSDARRNFENEIAQKKKIIEDYNNFAKLREADFQKDEADYEARLRKLENSCDEQLDKYKQHRIELINTQIDNHKQRKITDTQLQIEQNTQRAVEKVRESVEAYGEEVKGIMTDQINQLSSQINALRAEAEESQKIVDDYQDKRRLINEAIMRERAVKEQQAFYKVCLTENAKEDIQQLRTVMPHLHDSTALYKIIYDLYVARAVKDMEKRVLNNESFSGIYKITGPDGRVYIGKSTDIKARWQQHCKSAFHTGTISWALIHDEMEKVGIDQFTFEVIERAPKEKLTEREKFWIEFYEADKVGYNMRVG